MSGKAHEPTVQLFEREVQDREYSDADMRIEFYVLSQVMDEATKEALMRVLKTHRPQVAESIKRELDAVREP